VKYIEDVCKEEDLDKQKKQYIECGLKDIFLSLSYKQGVTVESLDMDLEHKPDANADIFGKFRIISIHAYKENNLTLHLKSNCSILGFGVSLDCEYMITSQHEELKQTYDGIHSYIKYIVNHYIDMEREDRYIKRKQYLWDYPIERAKVILRTGCENISKALLVGKLVHKKYKSYIIENFILHSIEKELSPAHPATRLVSNILGSLPLDDYYTRSYILQPIFFHSSWQTHYPKLGYALLNSIPYSMFHGCNIASMYECILEKKSTDLALKCLETYLKYPISNSNVHHLLSSQEHGKKIFDLILKEGKLFQFAKLQSILEKTKKSEESLNHIYVNWFISACIEPNTSLNVIIMTYNLIIAGELTSPHDYNLLLININFNKVIQVLESKKSILCSRDNKQSMEKYNTVLKKFRKMHPAITTGRKSLYQRMIETLHAWVAWIKSFFRIN
ncbi:hypothetical protein NEAUS03_2443, partial [Nematocida ausubeli]